MLHQLDATKSSTAWVSNGCYCWNIALYEPDAISDQSTAALINRQGLWAAGTWLTDFVLICQGCKDMPMTLDALWGCKDAAADCLMPCSCKGIILAQATIEAI